MSLNLLVCVAEYHMNVEKRYERIAEQGSPLLATEEPGLGL